MKADPERVIIEVEEGLEALLPCVINGDTSLEIVWEKNGEVVASPWFQSQRIFQTAGGNLQIEHSCLSDSGFYNYVLCAKTGETHRTVELQVKSRGSTKGKQMCPQRNWLLPVL